MWAGRHHRHRRSAINSHRSVLGPIDRYSHVFMCLRTKQHQLQQSTAFFCKQLFYDGIIVKPQIREYLSCLVNHSSCSMDTLTFVVSWKNTFYRLATIVLCSDSGMNTEQWKCSKKRLFLNGKMEWISVSQTVEIFAATMNYQICTFSTTQ